ncbi:hypothetical protein GCM10010361_53130 [Streptomyces olivaceiscleroticus]|uniref:Uncharacterized protein n=1 Tax=Streptomyces olivaceiscleroticus TaxID=68245 RepID=A0ABN1AQ59_9ACTN
MVGRLVAGWVVRRRTRKCACRLLLHVVRAGYSVGGLVQIAASSATARPRSRPSPQRAWPCGATAAHVSLDKTITTMKQTGADMKIKYERTSRGGLAVNVIEC